MRIAALPNPTNAETVIRYPLPIALVAAGNYFVQLQAGDVGRTGRVVYLGGEQERPG